MLGWIDSFPGPLHDFATSMPFALRCWSPSHQETEFISSPLDSRLLGTCFWKKNCATERSCPPPPLSGNLGNLEVSQPRLAFRRMRGSSLSIQTSLESANAQISERALPRWTELSPTSDWPQMQEWPHLGQQNHLLACCNIVIYN